MATISTLQQAIDPTKCPLCGQSNQCAMETERTTGVKQSTCWCSTPAFQGCFDEGLLTKIPAERRNLACICAACVQANSSKSSTAAARQHPSQ